MRSGPRGAEVQVREPGQAPGNLQHAEQNPALHPSFLAVHKPKETTNPQSQKPKNELKTLNNS